MAASEHVVEKAGNAKIVARSDVVVVGGGPAGFSAALAARREGMSVTLIERYAYLGGLASGGMVLVLDDMSNGPEVTVTGICMEMIERMAKVGACVFPRPRTAAPIGRPITAGRVGACSISALRPSRNRF